MNACEQRAARWPEWPWHRPVRLATDTGIVSWGCRVCMSVSDGGFRSWGTEAAVRLHTRRVHTKVLP